MNAQHKKIRFCLGLAVVLLGLGLRTISAQTNLVTLVPDGAWIWFNDPRAVVNNGILYFGHVRATDGRSTLSAFNPADGSLSNL